jgi:hypothetical protein
MPRGRTGPAHMEAVYAKQAEAAKLKRNGYGWDEVARMVGYGDRSAAFNAVRRLMVRNRELAYGEADLYRAESLERLEELFRIQFERALKGDNKATTQCRLIISQIGDLRGEKAPVKLEWADDDVNRLLREAQEEFDKRVAELDRQASGAAAGQAADG